MEEIKTAGYMDVPYANIRFWHVLTSPQSPHALFSAHLSILKPPMLSTAEGNSHSFRHLWFGRSSGRCTRLVRVQLVLKKTCWIPSTSVHHIPWHTIANLPRIPLLPCTSLVEACMTICGKENREHSQFLISIGKLQRWCGTIFVWRIHCFYTAPLWFLDPKILL
jgi:hypothetical protein